ncbi:probable GTP-binding protein OBGC2 isoform X2 [Phoenix dactylifera]|uniref:Probable GTP-binding protein OBGC2 isoform X2 n=1 Tax=Phoenix dactylifera TaxID=42345 RepID=A0A8B8JA69_PHODC|nr:probable GTP-binding protein OBGC2 isoform X2 [Phoenix dactylifera]
MALLLHPSLPLSSQWLREDSSTHCPFPKSLVFSTNRGRQWSYSSKGIQYFVINCRSARVKESPSTNAAALIREPHKYFDQVVITVRSGDGGHGAVLSLPNLRNTSKSQGKHDQEKSTKKRTYKRDSDGSLILPIGGHGGDVVIYADESKESLLEFHKKSRYGAKRGGNVDAMGTLTSQLHDGYAAPTLQIPVPVGTVVRRKRGKFLADLAHPGDEILVARGGHGGISLLEMPEHGRKRLMALSSNVMRDESDKVLVLGQPGEEVSLELILRVVADAGLVGLPNAGKSTLLAAITLAKPDIADYPFTTLMPNLGRLDGDPTLEALKYSSGATLADLPGLIEGAHLGKGLGRNFLRHLRRTRLLVHVVDAAAENPINDYRTVREELRMYNPDYLQRPYIVVLNKIDLPEARDRLPSLVQEVSKIGCREAPNLEMRQELSAESKGVPILSSGASNEQSKEKGIEDYPRPLAVVAASVLHNIPLSLWFKARKLVGIDEMLREIRAALKKCQDLEKALETKKVQENHRLIAYTYEQKLPKLPALGSGPCTKAWNTLKHNSRDY